MVKWHTENRDGYVTVINKGGAELSYDPESGLKLIEDDGFAFKDLNRNGVLDPYEDWRLPISVRTADLVSRMETDEKLSLMLHAGMFAVQRLTDEAVESNKNLRARISAGGGRGVYGGREDDFTQLDDSQMAFLKEDGLKFWLIGVIEDADSGTRFMNNVQREAEKERLGIPAFFSTNPRAFTDSHSDIGEHDVTSWPTNLGLAATFDPGVASEMAETVAGEYRSMGITIELGPQVDCATDPRWNRFNATYGSDPVLNADIGRAVCDAFQTSTGDRVTEDGWGYDSVMAVCKHWPGSTGEGGRESHSEAGRFAVYPGGNFSERLRPWTEGAFRLDGPTKQCASVMSCYDVLYKIGGKEAENVGTSFLRYAIDGLLREEYGFDGFVCTDFWITGDNRTGSAAGRRSSAWGMTDRTPAERAAKEIEAGIDQLGGLNQLDVLRQAYGILKDRHGEEWVLKRISASAERILKYGFRVGSFENPYRDPETAMETVGSHREQGLAAHRRSVILLKNSGILPARGKKVFIADKCSGGIPDRGGNVDPVVRNAAFSREEAEKLFTVADTPEEADFAIVLMDSPQSGDGTDRATKETVPISLQYGDYTAVNARRVSIGGEIVDGKKQNYSYRGKSVSTYNKYDLDIFEETKAAMGDKPVVAVLRCTNPIVPSEFEPQADAVLVIFGNTPDSVVFEALAGEFEPSGLLPFQMPASMDAVEAHLEDTPRDIEPYRDSAGNEWDFAYGMNWSGVIDDERVEKYR